MNPLTNIRQRQTPWTRRALRLFVVVWLGIAVAPCAMAMSDLKEHECAQCPPDSSEEAQSHSAQIAHTAMLGHSCATDVSQCEINADYNYDGRTVQIKLKKNASGDGFAAIISPTAISPAIDPTAIVCPNETAQQSGVTIPLNILYCVYLN